MFLEKDWNESDLIMNSENYMHVRQFISDTRIFSHYSIPQFALNILKCSSFLFSKIYSVASLMISKSWLGNKIDMGQ